MMAEEGLMPGKIALTGESHQGAGHFPGGDTELWCLYTSLPGLLPPSLASPLPITALGMEHPSLRSALGSHQ